MQRFNFEQILNNSPLDLLNWLLTEFSVEIPSVITSAEDMENAGQLLLRLSGHYSYLLALLSYTKIKTREAKRLSPKEEYEDLVDKKEILQNVTDAVKQNYSAISRAVTIYIENNNELRMSRYQ